jgi:DNA-binding response OmpR family regulator
VKPKVLLIDDDLRILSLQKTYLELEGFTVNHYDGTDPKSLEKILRENPPDVILLDVHLRNLDGFSLLRKLRQSAEYNSIPVVMTSGMDMSYKCKQEGANAFLMKPYMPKELVLLINELVPPPLN